MNALPLAAESFDQVLLMHALTYTRTPRRVINSASRLLRPGGTLLIATLDAHNHSLAEESFDHLNRGMSPHDLHDALQSAQLNVGWCDVACQEGRPPYFKVVVARAEKPR